MLSAVASSACCWLPLTLMGFGLSAGGLSAWFERYRLLFLIGAGSLLALGFYSAYFAGRRCGSACACDARTSRTQRFSRGMLWVSAFIVVAFAAFPKYAGAILSTGASPMIAVTGEGTLDIAIEGMTCEVCAVGLRGSLAELPGVRGAHVSYEDGIAELALDPGTPIDPQPALDAIAKAGFSGSVLEPGFRSPPEP